MTLVKSKPRPQTVAHRKRHALHHNQGKHYAKTYWPYLPLFFLLLPLGLATIVVWNAQVNQSVAGVYNCMLGCNTLAASNHLIGSDLKNFVGQHAALSAGLLIFLIVAAAILVDWHARQQRRSSLL